MQRYHGDSIAFISGKIDHGSSSGVTDFGTLGSYDATLQQVIQAAHPVPAIAVGLKQEFVTTLIVRSAVIVREDIHEGAIPLVLPQRNANLAWLRA
jgi:hypothetical protein